MTRRRIRLQAVLRGAGSIMDVYPDPDRYLRLVPAGTAEERLGEVWHRVGTYIYDASEKVRHESESSSHPEETVVPAPEGERRSS